MLLHRPSGDLFGWTQNAGMGWDPALLGGKEFLILSTHGGIRAADGTPVALGYHTGHWEVALLMDAAAKELKALGAVPFAAYCTDPCDGRTQGTTGMFDSLPYRNDAASIFGRLIRSLPTRRGVLGVATCDKGLPAMMMALAGARDLRRVLIPGGVTLLPEEGEDAGKVQIVGARFAHGMITLEDAAESDVPRLRFAGRRLPVSGHGGDGAGGGRSARHVAAAFGAGALGPPDLAGHGAALGARGDARLESARHHDDARCADGRQRAQCDGDARGVRRFDESDSAPAGDRVFGGPDASHGGRLDARQSPGAAPGGRAAERSADVSHRAGLPGGRRARSDAAPAARGICWRPARSPSPVSTLGESLDWWEQSERRAALRRVLQERDGVDPDDVIMDPDGARGAG